MSTQTSRNFLQRGLVEQIPYQPAREESSVAIILRGARLAWRIRIYAEGRPGAQSTGPVYVGSVRTLAWSGGDRVVAFACCPGAVAWHVDAQPEDHTATEQPSVDFMGAPCCGVFGVTAVVGVSLPRARHLGKLSGTFGAAIIPGPCKSFTCIGGAVAGSVSIFEPGDAAPTVIPLPPGASYSRDWNDGSGDVSVITFTNTVSYSVSYEVPGDGFDFV